MIGKISKGGKSMIYQLVRCIFSCICCGAKIVDEMGHEESVSDIPYEIEHHLGGLRESYILLYGYVKRHGHFPVKGEVYRNKKLGDWFISRLNLQKSDTMSLHELRAMAYIYDLLQMNPTFTDHQKRVISCPVLLVTMWADAETSARYILLWCFVSQFGRYPLSQDVYYNFRIGAWYDIITHDVSIMTQNSLRFIKQKLEQLEKQAVTTPLLPLPNKVSSLNT
jgi:hypothetical protein